MTNERSSLPEWFGRLLCGLGVHDFRLVESQVGFGVTGQVDRVECRRCGFVTIRRGQRR